MRADAGSIGITRRIGRFVTEMKFDHIPEVVAAITETRRRIGEHLSLPGMPREKILATLIRILDATGIASAMKLRHRKITPSDSLRCAISMWRWKAPRCGSISRGLCEAGTGSYRSAYCADCQTVPRSAGAEAIRVCGRGGRTADDFFERCERLFPEVGGEALTAKAFRTWTGTVECAVALRDIGEFESETEAKRNIAAAIKVAAERLGNRASTCRAYYVHPAVTEAYLAAELLPAMQRAVGNAAEKLLSAEEYAVLTLFDTTAIPKRPWRRREPSRGSWGAGVCANRFASENPLPRPAGNRSRRPISSSVFGSASSSP